MQINPVNLNNIQKNITEKVTKPIQNVVKDNFAATGVSAAALTGAYEVSKSLRERKENAFYLKRIGINQEISNKLLNAKKENGERVFGKNEIKILSDISQMSDKTVYNEVLKNAENIYLFEKITEGQKFTINMKSKIPEGNYNVSFIQDGGMAKIILQTETENKIYEKKMSWLNGIYQEVLTTFEDGDVIEKQIAEYSYDSENNLVIKRPTQITTFSPNGILKSVHKEVFDKNHKLSFETNDYERGIILKEDKYDIDKGSCDNIVRVIKNSTKTEITKREISEVPNYFNSYIIDEKGNKKIEAQAKYDKDGNIVVEKHLESLDGTKTNYYYKATPDEKDIKLHYQIVTKDGEVLTTIDRTFKRVNNSLAYSSVNGHNYKIENVNDDFIVTDEFNNTKTIIPKLDLVYNEYSNDEMLYKLPGDMLLCFAQKGYKYINWDKKEAISRGLYGLCDSIQKLIFSINETSVFAHEFGHLKDLKINGEKGYDVFKRGERQPKFSNNPEFLKTFKQEKAAFVKAFPKNEQFVLDYFFNDLEPNNYSHCGGREMIAESCAILSQSKMNASHCERDYYLQKYFPRTLAIVSKFVNPDANLFLNVN